MAIQKADILNLLGVDADLFTEAQASIKVRAKNAPEPFAEIVTENGRVSYRFGRFEASGTVLVAN